MMPRTNRRLFSYPAALSSAEQLFERNIAIPPRREHPDNCVEPDSDDRQKEREEHQQADQPHIESGSCGDSTCYSSGKPTGAAAKVDTSDSIKHFVHGINNRPGHR